ncbi:MAG: endonuclease [Gammaproteobacteria bacterium]
MPRIVLILLLLSSSVWSVASYAEVRRADFNTARAEFWQKLYPAGGWTLYCGMRFDNGRTEAGDVVEIDHIYPMTRAYKYLRCDSRLRCREETGVLYSLIESDLHNMYAAWQPLVIARLNTRFGELDGANAKYEGCDYRQHRGIVDPRPIARGNIARSLFYMRRQYGLPLPEDLDLLKAWHRGDPASDQEINRNDIIERVQGNRNPFIDNPELVNELK